MKKLTLCILLLVSLFTAVRAEAENDLWYAYLTEEGNILIADYTYEGERISELTLGRGEERYVSVTGTDKVSFYSTGSYVAKLGEDGTLTTGDAGESKLRVYVTDTHYVEIKVIVKKAPASIELNKKKTTLYLGSTETLKYTLSKNSAGAVSFLSSDDSVAWVDESGTVHPVKEGSCTITATTYNGRSCECDVTVELPAPAKVITQPCTGYAYETVSIPYHLEGGYNESVSFVSSDESILTVDGKGIVSCRKAGTADVTVTASRGGSAVCRVQVLPCASAIYVNDSIVYLYEGGLCKPDAVTVGGSGNYDISSRSPEIAAVEEGIIHALKAGSTIIELAAPGNAKTIFTLCVLSRPDELAFTCPDSIAMGEAYQADLGRRAYPYLKAEFSSSDESVLTVTDDGRLTGILPGTATVTVRVGSVSFSKDVKVDFMAKSMHFDRSALTLSPGDSLPLTVTQEGGIGKVSFFSSDESVAILNGSVLTAVGTGSVQITARLKNGVSATLPVIVNPAPGKISFGAGTVTMGRKDSYTPVLTFEDGHIALINWSISDESIATVSPEGTVHALDRDGICTVTASTNKGITASFRVIVSGSPAMPELDASRVPQGGLFTHYLPLSQGEEYDLNIRFPGYDSVTCTCSTKDNELISVDANGRIKALKQGVARVSVVLYNGTKAEIMVEITK